MRNVCEQRKCVRAGNCAAMRFDLRFNTSAAQHLFNELYIGIAAGYR